MKDKECICVICGQKTTDFGLYYFEDEPSTSLLRLLVNKRRKVKYNYTMCDDCHDFFIANDAIKSNLKLGFALVDNIFGIVQIMDMAICSEYKPAEDLPPILNIEELLP